MMRAFLAVSQVFDNPLALQQFNHLGEAVLQAFLRFLYFNFRHRRTPLPAAGRAGRINQSIHDWKNVLNNYWVSPWKFSKSPGGADGRNDTPPEGFKR
jgi:hypothetical protein